MNQPQGPSLPPQSASGAFWGNYPPPPVFGADPQALRPLLAGREDPGNLSWVRTSPFSWVCILHRDFCNGISPLHTPHPHTPTHSSPPRELLSNVEFQRQDPRLGGGGIWGRGGLSGPSDHLRKATTVPLGPPVPCPVCVSLPVANSTSTSSPRLPVLSEALPVVWETSWLLSLCLSQAWSSWIKMATLYPPGLISNRLNSRDL